MKSVAPSRAVVTLGAPNNRSTTMLSPDISKPTKRKRAQAQRRALRRLEFCETFGISVASFDRRVRAGEIKVVKIGHATIITEDELRRLGLIAA
jgi:predicted DNA-binding transcriptional regulator AlpA